MSDQASINESTYGGIADSYANKYGIPANIFRDTIRQASNFDPLQTSTKGSGIANLKMADSNVGLNPADVGQSLEIAAAYIADRYKDVKSWEGAAGNFLYGEPAAGNTDSKANDPIGSIPDPSQSAGATGNSKAFWQYGSQDWKDFFSRSAWTVLFFVIGIIIIIASIYVLIQSTANAK